MNVAFLPAHASFHSRRPLALHRSAFRHNALTTRYSSQSPKWPQVSVAPRAVTTASLRRGLSVLGATIPLILFQVTTVHHATARSNDSHHQAQNYQNPREAAKAKHTPLAIVTPAAASPAAVASPTPESTSVTPAKANPPEPKVSSRATLRQRFSFYMSEFLMWHPSAKVFTLLAFTLIAMFLGSFLYRFADPEREEAPYPFWHSVRAIANPLEDDWQKNSLRAASIALASFGMIVFAILVGMVTETVQSVVENTDGSKSRVVVSDHIVVCGWSPHVAQIIKDVNSVTANVKVVVLAPSDKKVSLIDEIRSVIPDDSRKNLRMYYRTGAPTIPQDLERVGAAYARKILLVNKRGKAPIDGDRLILSRALALRQNLPSFQGDIIAELNTARDEALVQSILRRSHARSVETVNTEQLLFRFMAQAIRQPGLADIVGMLMGDEPSSVFHVRMAKDAAPQLVGTSYADLRPTSVPGSIICGFVDENGQMHIENGPIFGGGGVVKPSTKILLLGASKSMGNLEMPVKRAPTELSSATSSIMQTFVREHGRGKPKAESFLVLGWRQDMEVMLQELDDILPKGSTVKVVDQNVPDKIDISLEHLKVSLIKKRADRYENISELIGEGSKTVDHIVIIGSSLGDEDDGMAYGEDDAKTLATLVYVNDALAKHRASVATHKMAVKTPLVTVEFINEAVAEMAKEQGGVANAILPQNLSPKIAAQTVRDSHLNAVWKELLSQVGREVYLRPVEAYHGIAGERVSFASVADRLARSADDIVIGYIPRYVPKVRINPVGQERFNARVWDGSDTLIVLSKE